MKKKLLALLLTVALSTCLVACGGDDADSDADTSFDKDDKDEDEDEDVTDSLFGDEDEKDDSDAPLTGELTFDIPEGFSDNGAGYFAHSDATVVANINITEVASDGSFATITKDMLLQAMEMSLEAGFGVELEVDMPVYENIKIDGRDAIKYTIEFEYAGIVLIQTQYIIDDVDYYRYVTYTSTEGDGYESIFEASGDSIRFE